jgi:hypothetical protein
MTGERMERAMNPYERLPDKAFWRPAIADRSMFQIDELWQPKFALRPKMPVATFGSCFAQHIGKALKARDFNWLITEHSPLGMKPGSAQEFNYEVFSCRTGNIYTTSLLRQWTSWALGKAVPPGEYWEASGRYYDPFRPAVEPGGFESRDEMEKSRQVAINAFCECIKRSKCFVFTLGLTESWVNATGGYEYPMCPGTVAGEFDESRHLFENQSFPVIRENLVASIEMMRQVNPDLKFLLTVSPVPLTATCSGKHVLVATTYSKSVLRAVAGDIAAERDFVDYFPSFEIINSPTFRGSFFEPNQRNVTAFGVDFVMSHFFDAFEEKIGKNQKGRARKRQKPAKEKRADEVCEEELLDAFGRRS